MWSKIVTALCQKVKSRKGRFIKGLCKAWDTVAQSLPACPPASASWTSLWFTMSKFAPHRRNTNQPRATATTVCQKCLGTGKYTPHNLRFGVVVRCASLILVLQAISPSSVNQHVHMCLVLRAHSNLRTRSCWPSSKLKANPL